MSSETTSQTTPTQTTPVTTDPRRLPAEFFWGLGVGLLAFVVSFRSTSVHEVNGVVTECSYTDYAALAAAVVVLICAGLGLRNGLRSRYPFTRHPAMVALAGLVLVALAVVHVLRGLGMVGGPC